MKIVLIGNGECALNKENGDFINKCNLIIRLGNFVLNGYEKYIGNRTDIYVSRWYKAKFRDESFFNSISEMWIPRTFDTREQKHDKLVNEYNLNNKIRYIPSEIIFGYKIKFPFNVIIHNTSKSVNKDLQCCLPDSGIIAIDMAKHFYPNSEIYISGFDNCKTGYYWLKGHETDKLSDQMLNYQYKYLKNYIDNKIIIDLSNSV